MNRIEQIADYYESLNRKTLDDREADDEDFRLHVEKVRTKFPDMMEEEWVDAHRLYMRRRIDRIQYKEVALDAQDKQLGAYSEEDATERWAEIARMRRDTLREKPN